MRTDCLILGAGIVGSAIAFELSRRGMTGIHVVDADLEGELSSSERNAGGVRHLWEHPVNVELSRYSIALFERIRTEIGFQQTGYLWLFASDEADRLKKLAVHAAERGITYERWDTAQITARYPFLDKTEDLAGALFGPRDGLINPNALKTYFRDEARKKGVAFHDRVWVRAARPSGSRVAVTIEPLPDQGAAQDRLSATTRTADEATHAETWEAATVVIALGAWTGELDIVGDLRRHLVPIRRQISMFKAEGFDMSSYGMVVDSSGVYFHPEGGNILGGFVIADEKPGISFRYDDDFFETHLWPPLYERSSRLERLKHVNGWAGLYAYTPDKSGVLGRVPGAPNVFEAHSFTGRGLMQSYGAAIALSELILDGKFSTIDASALSRERFADPARHLPEGLHI